MMLGERTHPSIQVPPWPSSPPPVHTPTHSPLLPLSGIDASSHSPSSAYLLNDAATLAALSRFLPSSNPDLSDDSDDASAAAAAAVDAYSCDEFRMYEFKVRRCARGRSHDWTECPYAHPGEKARRRDPRRYHYSGAACPDFRKGSCKRGDACEFAHGVFECWLHPARYRTQPCKDGVACRRRVCFFAHTPEQLRVLPGGTSSQHSPRGAGGGNGSSNISNTSAAAAFDSYDGSPMRQHHLASLEAYFPKCMLMSSSPTSTLTSPLIPPSSDSPPLSPSSGPSPIRRGGSSSVNELLASLRQLQLNSSPVATVSSSPWQQMACSPPLTTVRRVPPPPVSGFSSVPSTPTGAGVGVVLRKPPGGLFDVWDDSSSPMAVVESGRDLRARLAEKLSKENSLGRPVDGSAAAGPDVGWVSDLLN